MDTIVRRLMRVAGIVLVLACTLAPAVVSFFWWRATRSL